MKPIKIRHFCRLPLLLRALLLVAIPLSLWLCIAGIADGFSVLFAIALLLFIVVLIGGGFYFHYGLTITSKRVTVIYHNAMKSFRYEDVRYIEIGLDEESIWGEIKAKDQKLYTFYFDEFELSLSSLFSRFLTVKVSLSQKYIEKSINRLSKCDKVRISKRKPQ